MDFGLIANLIDTIHDLELPPTVHNTAAKLKQVWAGELQTPQRGQPRGGSIQELLH